MRQKYLEAVKKMRLKKGNRSALAFIFSSESFSQAMRRMRYLKQFSEWRDNQSALIAKKVGKLKYQTQLLAQTKNDKDRALRSHMTAQRNLEQQHARQDVVVADLKKNGEALRSHLAKKQSEANDLRNRVAALIAQEQAAAEARRREEERREQARIAEKERQERLRAEAEAKEKAEEVRRQELAEALKPKKEDKESPQAVFKAATSEYGFKELYKKFEDMGMPVSGVCYVGVCFAVVGMEKEKSKSQGERELLRFTVFKRIEEYVAKEKLGFCLKREVRYCSMILFIQRGKQTMLWGCFVRIRTYRA